MGKWIFCRSLLIVVIYKMFFILQGRQLGYLLFNHCSLINNRANGFLSNTEKYQANEHFWTGNNSTWAMIWPNRQNGCAPSEDSDQPGHPPSLIRVFAVRMKKPLVLSYPLSAQQLLRSDWADAQADLSLCWAHMHVVGFVMSRLTWRLQT